MYYSAPTIVNAGAYEIADEHMLTNSLIQKSLLSGLLLVLSGASLTLSGVAANWRILGAQVSAGSSENNDASRIAKFACLPKDIQLDEPVSYSGKGNRKVTVEQKLAELKARCRHGKLVDARRREIRFFRPSCWGNPPPDYLEIKKRENEELAKLKKRYTVIAFGCNPMIQ